MFAWLRPGRDLTQQAADAKAGNIVETRPLAGKDTVEDPVETILARAAGAAGCTDDRRFADAAENEKITRVNRHSHMIDHAAGPPDRRRNDVFGIGDRRSAEDDQQVVR